jgi:hypothetical protein
VNDETLETEKELDAIPLHPPGANAGIIIPARDDLEKTTVAREGLEAVLLARSMGMRPRVQAHSRPLEFMVHC